MLQETYFNNSAKDNISTSGSSQDLTESTLALVEMGFDYDESEDAIKKSGFVLNNAVSYLLGKKEKEIHEENKMDEDALYNVDPKSMLFSNITGEILKDNSVINYFRYIVYSLDGILERCCICNDKLQTKSTKIK